MVKEMEPTLLDVQMEKDLSAKDIEGYNLDSLDNGHLISVNNIKYDIYEKNEKCITVFAYVRKLNAYHIDFENTGFVFKFKTDDEKFRVLPKSSSEEDSVFVWKVSTIKDIEPDQCSYKVSPSKIELYLIKKSLGRWDCLISSPDIISNNPPEQITNNSSQPFLNNTAHSISSNVANKISNDASQLNNEPNNHPKAEIEPEYYPEDDTSYQKSPQKKEVCKPGLVGLINLGNTCYMNSVIQCLSNVETFRNYFLSTKYKLDVNSDNPLGFGGRLAYNFAGMLRELWSGKKSTIAPSAIKSIIASKATQFSGILQHDAQELLTFLLDGLHEDLNRVKVKPTGETIEFNNKSEEQIAMESWTLHERRNSSIVVDLFNGQYKSVLTCHDCNKISTTFDPFVYLNIPLPKDKIKTSIIYFSSDVTKKPKKIVLRVHSTSSVEDLKEIISRKTQTKPQNMRLLEVVKQDIITEYKDGQFIEEFNLNKNLYVFEMINCPKEELIEFDVIQKMELPEVIAVCSYCKKDRSGDSVKPRRCTNCYKVAYCDRACQSSQWKEHKEFCKKVEPVGQPFKLGIKKSQPFTLDKLKKIMNHFARWSVDINYSNTDAEDNATSSFGHGDDDNKAETDSDKFGPKELQASEAYFNLYAVNSLTSDNKTRVLLNDPITFSTSNLKLTLEWNERLPELKEIKVTTKDLDWEEEECDDDDSPEVSLHQCLQLFTKPEKLTQEEAWYCPTCKDHKLATKKMTLWRLPNILIIQLKRFSFLSYMRRSKLDTFVSFPVSDLNMSPYTCQPSQAAQFYDLIGIVNHYGNMFGGHYTTYSSPYLNEWYCYDDAYVSPVNKSKLVSKSAYILFYKLREIPAHIQSGN